MPVNYQNLLITGVNSAWNSPVPGSENTQLYVNENTPSDIVIGVIHGFADGEQPDQLAFTVNNEPGSASGRYEIVRATAAMVNGSNQFAEGDWVLVLRNAGAAYDYESDIGVEHVSFTVSGVAGYTPVSEYGAEFTFRVMDVNEAPKDIRVGGTSQPVVREESPGAVVGLLSTTDEDDINNANAQAQIHYTIVADPVSGTMLDGGLFTITDQNELKLLDGVELDWDNAKVDDQGGHYYEVMIVATDSGGYVNGQQDGSVAAVSSAPQYVRIYVAQNIPNTAPQGITLTRGTVTDTSTTVAEDLAGEVGQLSAQDDLGVNGLTFTFAEIPGGNGAHYDGGGRFIIDPATKKIMINPQGPGLDFEGQVVQDYGLETDGSGNKFYRLKVVATDQGGLSAEQDILVYVTGVNEAPDAPEWTAAPLIDENAGVGDVVGTLAADDIDGDTVGFRFEDAFAGSDGLISGDQAFKIVLENGVWKIVVNDPQQLVFNTGDATKPFNYKVVATDGSLASAPVDVAITVNNAPPKISFAGNAAPVVTHPEGNPQGPDDEYTDFTFDLVRTGDLSEESDVRWVLTGLGLTAEDVEGGLFSGEVRFASGIGAMSFTIRIRKDAISEGQESFTVTLESVANTVVGANNTGTLVVQDDDGANNPPHTIVLTSGGVADTKGSVEETVGGGHVVGVLSAQDDGSPDDLTYEFVGGYASEALFQINANHEIELIGPVNFETPIDPDAPPGSGLEQDQHGKFYRLLVRVTDQGNPQLSAEQEIKVYVTDVNEAPDAAVWTPSATINENAGADAVVGILAATDVDGTIPGFKFLNSFDADGLISGDQRFKIVLDGGIWKIVVNDPDLIQVTTGASATWDYQVVATDGALDSGAATDVSITVDDVPLGNTAPTNVRFNSASVTAAVRENTGQHSTIAEIIATDDDGDLLSYTLVDNADGRFQLVKDEGTGRWLLKVDRSIGIDFEQAKFHTIQVQAHEEKNGGLSSEVTTLRINVRDSLIEIVSEKDTSDRIFGGAFGDNLRGGKGDDILRGNAGNDTLTGGEGNDVFQFQSTPSATTNKDLIKDFRVGTGEAENDMIWLNRQFGFTGFTSAEAGKLLDPDGFVNGTEATKARAQILYNKATGELFYDADGTLSTTKGPVLFAVLDPASRPDLTHANFWIYSGL